MSDAERDALSAALGRFMARTDALISGPIDRNNNAASITINAGGVGVWIASTACVVMLACNVFLAAIVMSNNREISDLNDKLSAIYMMAPQLQPQTKEPE